MARTKNSAVMVIANHLVKEGYSRSTAMVKAWILVKLPALLVKVKGVTYGNRQRAIEHLTRYTPEDIHISLERDAGNSADRNATAVVAAVKGKGSYVMGYLPRPLAALIAPVVDRVHSRLKEIRGGYDGLYYGLVVEVGVMV